MKNDPAKLEQLRWRQLREDVATCTVLQQSVVVVAGTELVLVIVVAPWCDEQSIRSLLDELISIIVGLLFSLKHFPGLVLRAAFVIRCETDEIARLFGLIDRKCSLRHVAPRPPASCRSASRQAAHRCGGGDSCQRFRCPRVVSPCAQSLEMWLVQRRDPTPAMWL